MNCTECILIAILAFVATIFFCLSSQNRRRQIMQHEKQQAEQNVGKGGELVSYSDTSAKIPPIPPSFNLSTKEEHCDMNVNLLTNQSFGVPMEYQREFSPYI